MRRLLRNPPQSGWPEQGIDFVFLALNFFAQRPSLG